MSTNRPLLRGTRIWQDPETGKEHQAPCAVRWDAVDFMQQDVDSGLKNWEYQGPITYITAGEVQLHLLGKLDQRWEAYENSQTGYVNFLN
jgi:hypothetical protein